MIGLCGGGSSFEREWREEGKCMCVCLDVGRSVVKIFECAWV